MPFQCFTESLMGARSENQDFALGFYLGSDLIALVCDGLGGYRDGGWAAAAFAHAIQSVATSMPPAPGQTPEQTVTDWLQSAWSQFCQQRQLQRRHEQAQTTFTLAWVSTEFTLVAHAGDSRIYGLDQQQIMWQTRDHNLYQLGIMNGEIDPNKVTAAYGHNALLYRCVGSLKPLEPTIAVYDPITEDQAVVLCSDGVWAQVFDQEWLELVTATDAANCLGSLLRRAVQRGGARADNATAVLVQKV